jgi:hypothetical protein
MFNGNSGYNGSAAHDGSNGNALETPDNIRRPVPPWKFGISQPALLRGTGMV